MILRPSTWQLRTAAVRKNIENTFMPNLALIDFRSSAGRFLTRLSLLALDVGHQETTRWYSMLDKTNNGGNDNRQFWTFAQNSPSRKKKLLTLICHPVSSFTNEWLTFFECVCVCMCIFSCHQLCNSHNPTCIGKFFFSFGSLPSHSCFRFFLFLCVVEKEEKNNPAFCPARLLFLLVVLYLKLNRFLFKMIAVTIILSLLKSHVRSRRVMSGISRYWINVLSLPLSLSLPFTTPQASPN